MFQDSSESLLHRQEQGRTKASCDRNLDDPQQAAMSLAHEAMSRWQAGNHKPVCQLLSLRPLLLLPLKLLLLLLLLLLPLWLLLLLFLLLLFTSPILAILFLLVPL